MTWLLMLFGLALVCSPLMWLKQSPHQRRVTELRRVASSLTLQVSLHRRPDTRDDELRLESVCYRLPWTDSQCRQNWVVHKFSERGWDSHCIGWRWFGDQARPELNEIIADTVRKMPESVSAIIANSAGIGVIWDERGEVSDVQQISELLLGLRQKAEEISL
jgi:hypothetical protein